MQHIHPAHGSVGLETAFPLVLTAGLALAYVFLARRRRKEAHGWNHWRTIAFLTGTTFLGLGLTPQLLPLEGLPRHMCQHLLIGMYAPIGLVLGAPVTLLLRSLPRRHGRTIGRVLASDPMRVIAHPATALALNLGGLVALYFTPLYSFAEQSPALHHLIHLHFLAAGYLFAWTIAGPDPAPHRPPVPARLVLLGIAIVGHAVVSQLIYAGLFVQVVASVGELRQAGELMYYAGDIAELILAFAMVSTWRSSKAKENAAR